MTCGPASACLLNTSPVTFAHLLLPGLSELLSLDLAFPSGVSQYGIGHKAQACFEFCLFHMPVLLYTKYHGTSKSFLVTFHIENYSYQSYPLFILSCHLAISLDVAVGV